MGHSKSEEAAIKLDDRLLCVPEKQDDVRARAVRTYSRAFEGERRRLTENDLVGLYHNQRGEFNTAGLYLSTNSIAMAITSIMPFPGKWKMIEQDGNPFVAFQLKEQNGMKYGTMLYEVNRSGRKIRLCGADEKGHATPETSLEAALASRTSDDALRRDKSRDVLPRIDGKSHAELDAFIAPALQQMSGQ